MNREILFRGTRLCDGKIVNGALVMVKENDESEKYIPNIVISYGPDTFDWFEVDPETVGQYTGIDDREGDKIFALFGFFTQDSEWHKENDWLKIEEEEVIGNIHDNKELLK